MCKKSSREYAQSRETVYAKIILRYMNKEGIVQTDSPKHLLGNSYFRAGASST